MESTKHHTNLFTVIVGETGKGRKGTGGDRVKSLFGDGVQKRTAAGLSSGEGLIHRVRDERYEKRKTKKGGVTLDEKDELVDQGVEDKRLIVHESEFQNAIVVMKRDGNTLSTCLRNAWDTGTLTVMTKNSPLRATDAHISIIGNITMEEVKKSLPAVEGENGFANRFLWILSRRSKMLAFGGEGLDLSDLQIRMKSVMEFARQVGKLTIDPAARNYWETLYTGELAQSLYGIVGKITNRSEPQVLRLAMIYAILDCSTTIQEKHLRAALAVWRYALQSAKVIFGDSTGDPVADKILDKLKTGPRRMTELHALFNNHCPPGAIRSALNRLCEQKRVCREQLPTGGRPSEVYRLM